MTAKYIIHAESLLRCDSMLLDRLILQSWGMDGYGRSRGEAFGIGVASRMDPWNFSPSLKARDYVFTITVEDDCLHLIIDTYTARHGPFGPDNRFDDEAWEAGMLYITGPATRKNFRVQHRIARALLNGRSVAMADGSTLLPIRGGRV